MMNRLNTAAGTLSVLCLMPLAVQAQSTLAGHTMYLQATYTRCLLQGNAAARCTPAQQASMIYFANDGSVFVYFDAEVGVVIPPGQKSGTADLGEFFDEVVFSGWTPSFSVTMAVTHKAGTGRPRTVYEWTGNASTSGCSVSSYRLISGVHGAQMRDARPLGCTIRRGRHAWPKAPLTWPIAWP